MSFCIEFNKVRVLCKMLIFFAALKHLMQRVFERLMGAGVSVEDEEEDSNMTLPKNRVSCSMSALCQWYKTLTKVRQPVK